MDGDVCLGDSDQIKDSPSPVEHHKLKLSITKIINNPVSRVDFKSLHRVWQISCPVRDATAPFGPWGKAHRGEVLIKAMGRNHSTLDLVSALGHVCLKEPEPSGCSK